MPITFDTLDELKSFYSSFKPLEGALKTTLKELPEEAPVKRRPGRPAKAVEVTESEPKRRGRKKAEPSPEKKLPRQKAVKATVVKVAPRATQKVEEVKARKGRPKVAGTLTAKIEAIIQKYLSAGKAFTANDIYADISKKDKTINKQSVITSVLKIMNSQFSNIRVGQRAGAGPRPVKVYQP